MNSFEVRVKRISFAALACAGMCLSAVPVRAADPPDFTFNVHVKVDYAPNVEYGDLMCMVYKANGSGIDNHTRVLIHGKMPFDQTVAVEIRRKNPDDDMRQYKSYVCWFTVATMMSTDGAHRPSAYGLTATNDGELKGDIPPQ